MAFECKIHADQTTRLHCKADSGRPIAIAATPCYATGMTRVCTIRQQNRTSQSSCLYCKAAGNWSSPAFECKPPVLHRSSAHGVDYAPRNRLGCIKRSAKGLFQRKSWWIGLLVCILRILAFRTTRQRPRAPYCAKVLGEDAAGHPTQSTLHGAHRSANYELLHSPATI